MPSVRLHDTNPDWFIVDIDIGGRQQIVSRTVESVLETIKLDPAFKGFKSPPFTLKHLADRERRRLKSDGIHDTKSWAFGLATRHFNHRRACDLTSSDISKWATGLLARYAYGSVVHAVASLGRIYREAVKVGLLLKNPTLDACEQYKSAAPDVITRFMNEEEKRNLLSRTPKPGSRVLLRLALEAGVKGNAICVLKHASFVGNALKIERVQNSSNQEVDAMSHRRRFVPLTAELMSDLDAYRAETGAAPNDLLFPARGGGQVSHSALSQRVDWLLARAGFGTWIERPALKRDGKPRALKASGKPNQPIAKGRYTLSELTAVAAIKWLRSGVNPVLVQRRMGYANYPVFDRRYRPFIDNHPTYPDVTAVDRLIWGATAIAPHDRAIVREPIFESGQSGEGHKILGKEKVDG